jgi:tyrosine-protein kinase Etk/Wzc
MDFRKASRVNHAVDYTKTFTVHDLEITLRHYISFRSNPQRVLPFRYPVVTKLMPPQQSPSSASILMKQLTNSGVGSLAAMAGVGLLQNPNDLYVGLLYSRPVAHAIIQKFNLAQIYRAKDMTAAREKLAKYIAITSLKEGFIVLAVSDKDKKRAAQLANAYTDELRSLTKSLAVT